jgi:CubicO group peptidase (beta-lactamase class C family)
MAPRWRTGKIAAWCATAFTVCASAACEVARIPGEPHADTATDAEPFQPAAATVTAFIEAGVGAAYPGAAFAVGVGPRADLIASVGRIGWRDASPAVVTDSTLYDLASLTKAMATAVAVLLLVQDGEIELDDPVRRHLPEFEGIWKDDVSWRHLLTHTSGLPPGGAIRGSTPAERQRRLLRTRLLVPPGTTVSYSDLGFMALWAAAQRVAGEPLDGLLERRVWQPLGMTSTRFAPGRDCEACAPSLRLRTGEPFRGLPSDQLARALGSVTGNAGLFATVGDVARFTAMIANGGELDGVRVLDEVLVAELFRQQPGAGRRTLGWTAICPDEEPDATVPCRAPTGYGHNGWTGTSIWIDPGSGRWAVILTNRSYERPNRPFPLEGLRRDLVLYLNGVERNRPPDHWLARVQGPASERGSLGETNEDTLP